MRPLRVSAISFLNTAPLMWDFDQGMVPRPEAGPRACDNLEISYTVPSHCARDLRAGTSDIGIIPAITYATIPGLAILPDAAIAARGPVRSILLVSKTPLSEIRTVAADSSSRTSVALAEVLFRKFLGGARTFAETDPDLASMLQTHDAALLIGDSALRIPLQGSGYHIFDLSELWHHYTGHAFAFAFWAVRLAALKEVDASVDWARMFRQSRDHGLEHASVEEIARQWSPHVGVSKTSVQEYITRNIHYFLDERTRLGLELFYRYAAECGLIPTAPELRFLETASPAPGHLPAISA
ncbi:MAG: menaquinone biosynthetic enzyme MqnA/MqnD family protein [Candidatus Korobacteraceae bacterium]